MIIHKCAFCGKDFDKWDIQEGFGFHFPRIGYERICRAKTQI